MPIDRRSIAIALRADLRRMSDAESSSGASDDEFIDDEELGDVEDTIAEAEQGEAGADVEDELRALQAEAEMDLDELRAMYAGPGGEGGSEGSSAEESGDAAESSCASADGASKDAPMQEAVHEPAVLPAAGLASLPDSGVGSTRQRPRKAVAAPSAPAAAAPASAPASDDTGRGRLTRSSQARPPPPAAAAAAAPASVDISFAAPLPPPGRPPRRASDAGTAADAATFGLAHPPLAAVPAAVKPKGKSLTKAASVVPPASAGPAPPVTAAASLPPPSAPRLSRGSGVAAVAVSGGAALPPPPRAAGKPKAPGAAAAPASSGSVAASSKHNFASMSLSQLLARRAALLAGLRGLGDAALDEAYPQSYRDLATGATLVGTLAPQEEASLQLGGVEGGDEEAAASVALDLGALLDAEPADAADAGHGGAASGSAGPVASASLAPLVPPRPPTHWDVLLEENKWLAGVSASPPPCRSISVYPAHPCFVDLCRTCPSSAAGKSRRPRSSASLSCVGTSRKRGRRSRQPSLTRRGAGGALGESPAR